MRKVAIEQRTSSGGISCTTLSRLVSPPPSAIKWSIRKSTCGRALASLAVISLDEDSAPNEVGAGEELRARVEKCCIPSMGISRSYTWHTAWESTSAIHSPVSACLSNATLVSSCFSFPCFFIDLTLGNADFALRILCSHGRHLGHFPASFCTMPQTLPLMSLISRELLWHSSCIYQGRS